MQGFAGVPVTENASPARSLGRSRPSRRGAENAIGLARRRGGGTTARAEASATGTPAEAVAVEFRTALNAFKEGNEKFEWLAEAVGSRSIDLCSRCNLAGGAALAYIQLRLCEQ